MNAIAALYAEQALRLANERQRDLRAEARLARRPANDGVRSGLRARLANLRAALATVDADRATPTLSDLPSRG